LKKRQTNKRNPVTSLSTCKIRLLVILPKQKTRVRFDSFDSCSRYCKDLKTKKIPYECRFYYEES
jgi:hypothetical protein